MRYLLDTNVVSALMRRDPHVGARLRSAGHGAAGISSIVVQEFSFGAHQSPRRDVYLEALKRIELPIVDFSRADGGRAGELRAALAQAGTPIGAYDVLIAGQALARELVLVTHNVREFARVGGLAVEDWEA